VGLKDRDSRIARTRNEVYASEQAAVYPGAVNPFHTGGYRRMAVSYECEHRNTRTVPPSGGQCIFKTKGSSRDYHPWCQSQGRMAGLQTSHWSARASWTRRGAAPHVSSDQETWRPKVISKQQSPLSPLHRQQQISAADAQSPWGSFIIIDCRQWIHMS
jgi:hypothetical protein